MKGLRIRMKAFITGVTGQDGSYLAELLIENGYQVYGTKSSSYSDSNKNQVINKVQIFNVESYSNTKEVIDLIKDISPDEIYHLASIVDARVEFESEKSIFDSNLNLGYEILRANLKYKLNSKIFFAGSSLMFGNFESSPQNEDTPMRPNTPYGIAKVTLYNLVKMYRDIYNSHVCMGILYNHESNRRNDFFLPKKISKSAARIKLGFQDKLVLGDISIKRDWSHAKDIVRAMWLMNQSQVPRDYVIGSGVLNSVENLLNIAFSELDLDWRDFVILSKELVRKVDYMEPCADIRRIKSDLDWEPEIEFENLIRDMVRYDYFNEKRNT